MGDLEKNLMQHLQSSSSGYVIKWHSTHIPRPLNSSFNSSQMAKLKKYVCFLHFPLEVSLHMQMGQDLHFQANLVDLRCPLILICDLWPQDIQRSSSCINKPSLIIIRLQLFKWGHLYIFNLSFNLKGLSAIRKIFKSL